MKVKDKAKKLWERLRPPLPTTAVDQDRWDRLDWESARGQLERLAEVTESLAEVNPVAPDAMADLYSSLAKGSPRLVDEVQPSHAVNRAVMAQIMDTDGWKDLRQYTVGSQVQSALACIAMRDKLADAYEGLDDAQEKADQAQAAQDALEKLLEQAGEPGEDGEMPAVPEELGASIETAQDLLDGALAELDAALDQAAPGIGRMARQATSEAAAEAEERAEAMTAWGTGPGDWDRMDAGAYLELADRLSTDRMRRIAELLGAMRNLTWGERQRKVNIIPEEVFDVEFGNQLSRLLPTEYAALAVPEIEDEFYRRYTQNRLLQYAMRGWEKEGKGSIIYLEDGSGSMKGAKELWAKAFGLALLSIAKEEGRGFHAIHFGNEGQTRIFSFPEPATYTTERMLDFAECFLCSAGTGFQTPFDQAVGMLAAEFEMLGHTEGDIVFATDGDSRVGQAWLEAHLAEKARLGFSTYGLPIGAPSSAPMFQALCDKVATVNDFLSGKDVRDVFRALQ